MKSQWTVHPQEIFLGRPFQSKLATAEASHNTLTIVAERHGGMTAFRFLICPAFLPNIKLRSGPPEMMPVLVGARQWLDEGSEVKELDPHRITYQHDTLIRAHS